MGNPQSERIYTIDEYLDFEEQSEEKHEYIGGYIYPLVTAMAGTEAAHSRISMILSRIIGSHLRDGCEDYSADMKIHIEAVNVNTYADYIVVCGKADFLPNNKGKKLLLLNPKVIVEVLSEYTDAYDHSDKWISYQTIPTLTDYIMIASDMHLIEHFQRSSNKWLYEQSSGLDGSLYIESLGLNLAVADIYENVVLAPSYRRRGFTVIE